MVRSEQHGRRAFWALAAVALLAVAMVAVVAGCGSSSAAADTSSTVAAQNTTGQTGPTGTPPSGFPGGGTPPSGMPGQTTSSSDSSTPTTTEAAATTTTTVAPTTSTSLADGQYGDGIYKAGTDLSSGLYKGTVVSGTGHWEITSDANGARFVASGDPTGSFYVKVTSGQYLRLTGVVIEEASSTASDPLATSDLKDGTYRVGYDIEEGWYTGTVTGQSTIGYWQVSTDANGQKLTASDYPMGSFTVKVTDGQYLTLRGVTVSLQQ